MRFNRVRVLHTPWIRSEGNHWLISTEPALKGYHNWYAFKGHFNLEGRKAEAESLCQAALDLLIDREGCEVVLPDGRIQSYWDDLGGLWTIGFGTTHGVTKDTIISYEEAVNAKRADLAQVRKEVSSLFSIQPLLDTQIDAVTLLAYNVGIGLIIKSRLVRYILSCEATKINPLTVRELFGRWNMSGIPLRPVAGLSLRRMMEADLFNGKDWQRWKGQDKWQRLVDFYGSGEAAGL